jgi:hypothetical protein
MLAGTLKARAAERMVVQTLQVVSSEIPRSRLKPVLRIRLNPARAASAASHIQA